MSENPSLPRRPPLACLAALCSLVATSPASAQLLPNGDFESGPVVWTESSSNGYDLILPEAELFVPTFGGTWAAWLGGDDLEISSIDQTVAVPDESTVRLTYQHWIDSADDCGFDFASVLVDSVVVRQYDLCDTTSTGGWVLYGVDLSAYAGQTVAIQIRVETDSVSFSDLFVDDVAFDTTPPSPDIFADGFESGDTSAWSMTVP